MGLKKLFTLLISVTLALELGVFLVSTWFVLTLNHQYQTENTISDYNRILNVHMQELIGNVMINHRSLTESFLESIGEKERVSIFLNVPLMEYKFKVPGNREGYIEKTFPLKYSGKNYGEITFYRKQPSFLSGIRQISVAFILFQTILISGIFIFFYVLTKRSVVTPIENLIENARTGNFDQTSLESRWIPKDLKNLFILLSNLWKDYEEKVKEASFGKISSQVAHDIRSPLAALKFISSSLQEVPESHRFLVRSAISRIEDIANNLLNQYRDKTSLNELSSEKEPSVHLLSNLIEMLLTEKRARYRDRPGVVIEADMNEGSYGLFATIQPIEFQRVISNLIDNSVEAIPGSGKVTVSLSSFKSRIFIRVSDTGKGIPTALIDNLGKNPVSFDKPGGSGLGLLHAVQTVKKWGGLLFLESEPNRGTTVQIELAKESPPDWFVHGFLITKDTRVVVLDDDPSIHHVWSEKLTCFDVELLHFYKASEFEEWMQTDGIKKHNVSYLLDYEFMGESTTGVDLIDKYSIENNSIIVTNRFEESAIRDRCQDRSVRMIPKLLVPVLPINQIDVDDRIEVAVIHNDPLVRRLWEMSADTHGIRMKSFWNVDSFLRLSHLFSEDIKIYLEADFKDEFSEEHSPKKISKRGFKNLMGLKGFQLKTPPWQHECVG